MAVFEFAAGEQFHFATSFAAHYNLTAHNDRVNLPAWLGAGFIQEVTAGNGLSLCIHSYTLQEELVLKRNGSAVLGGLTIKFDCRRIVTTATAAPLTPVFSASRGYEAELGTTNFFSTLTLPAHQAILFIVINTSRKNLVRLLQLEPAAEQLRSTLLYNDSFVRYEAITYEMDRVVRQLASINTATPLFLLSYQNKSQELLYYLFTQLLSRQRQPDVAVTDDEVKKIYELRAAIVTDLSITPRLQDLSRKTGMSLTRMKQVFTQVFGRSIYKYYQAERMNRAALLLASHSVSETGYEVGFTNLSHFTRLFERHHQVKPKRFKAAIKTS